MSDYLLLERLLEPFYYVTLAKGKCPVYGVVMGLMRVLICLFCPPLAVLDKGCGSFLIVLILTGAGWVPGTIAALVICNNSDN